jgi:hypothetical protein
MALREHLDRAEFATAGYPAALFAARQCLDYFGRPMFGPDDTPSAELLHERRQLRGVAVYCELWPSIRELDLTPGEWDWAVSAALECLGLEPVEL